MARRRRRRRSFGSYVSIPTLGNLKEVNPLGKSVNSTDVILGAAIGLAGSALVKAGISKLDVAIGGKVPKIVMDYIAPISTFGAGVLAYFVAKKFLKSQAKANGYLVGAAAFAGGSVAWNMLKQAAPTYFNDYVAVSPMGLLTQDAGFGLLTQDAGMSGFGEEESVFEAP